MAINPNPDFDELGITAESIAEHIGVSDSDRIVATCVRNRSRALLYLYQFLGKTVEKYYNRSREEDGIGYEYEYIRYDGRNTVEEGERVFNDLFNTPKGGSTSTDILKTALIEIAYCYSITPHSLISMKSGGFSSATITSESIQTHKNFDQLSKYRISMINYVKRSVYDLLVGLGTITDPISVYDD